MTSETVTGDKEDNGAGIRSLLVEWANEQDGWLRLLVSDVIAARKELPDTRVGELYETYLVEKELQPGEHVEVSLLAAPGLEGSISGGLVLKKLRDVRAVNALSSDQEIEFHPRLTLIYGENGAGKTGYVRVLKRIGGVRTAEPILPNVFGAGAAISPEATLSYLLDGEELQVEWRDEAGVYPFTRLDVFDARAARLHVDEDLSYVFTPGELSLFPMVQQGVERIQGLLDKDIRRRGGGSNPYPSLFDRRSRLYPKIEALGAATNLEELQQIAKISKAEMERAEQLKQEVEALRSSSPGAHLALAESQARRLEAIIRGLDVVVKFDDGAYATALGALEIAARQHDEAGKTAFVGMSVPGILGEEWRALIEAGEAYLNAIGRGEYPLADESCIYCQQRLGEAAAELVRKYRRFAADATRKTLNQANRRVNDLTASVLGLDLGALRRAAEEYEAGGGKAGIKAFLGKLDAGVGAAREKRADDWGGTLREAGLLKDLIEGERGTLVSGAAELRREGAERDKALKERELALVELETRKLLGVHLGGIEKYIQEAKWLEQARSHAARFRHVLRSLTDRAKVASERLVNQDFEKRFLKECEVLRAPAVKLEFPGREGRVVRRKAVALGHKPSEILSEGEQKVIAVADFLAEVGLKRPPAPVVFDDPITSLDYRRMSEVVRRLVELSNDRQVIIFTHNIWFAVEILSRFEDRPTDCFYYDVRKEDDRLGIVSKGAHPRADTVNADKKKINELIEAARKATGVAREALIEKGYEYLRNICEVIAEAELLQGVTQRYQPNVMMTKLRRIRVDRLQGAIDGIMPVYERACRAIGSHAQPLETLNVRPTLGDLEADWKTVQETRSMYIKE